MHWEQLLALRRQGDTLERLRREQDESRLGFEVDYDRVIFSSAFRSLQDKTQVIPLSQTDFVHTRLTHSLEVSVVGRSLGRIAGRQLLEKHPGIKEKHGYAFGDFGAIVAAAALAHDIGNPPFGHSGEKAIGAFFSSGPGKQWKGEMKPAEFQDLADFEGNANGFRLLNQSREGVEGGLRLSYATLGAFTKYPRESLPSKSGTYIGEKKFGFFQSERGLFLEVAEILGMPRRNKGPALSFSRHPLAFLVEAADDICYTIIDFEDGINLGLIPEEYALEYLIKLVQDRINTKTYHRIRHMQDRLGYLRALAINTLITDAAGIFLREEEAILAGDFRDSLLAHSQFKAQVQDILQLSMEKIYRSEEVVAKELAGYRILTDLLEIYSGALVRHHEDKATGYDRLLLLSLPENFKDCQGSIYEILLQLCAFVAGLSDSGAVQLHNKITGRRLQL